MANHRSQLDNRIQIVTPENIAVEYRVAGPFVRLPAYLLDLLIRIGVFLFMAFVISIISTSTGLFGMGIGGALVILFLMEWLYGGIFETFWNGQTPGKRMMNLRVVSIDGQPINALQAVLRNVLRSVDGMPLLVQNYFPTFLVGLLTTTTNHRFQRLGDLACSTMVIIEDRQQLYGVVRVKEPVAIALALSLPAGFPVSRSLARALSQYVERRRVFPPARRAEIARTLGAALIEKMNLSPSTNHDVLLCALYHRTFITDRAGDESAMPVGQSPFAPVATPVPTPITEMPNIQT
jgi:uncharacterized RDD family membrane protein YckC